MFLLGGTTPGSRRYIPVAATVGGGMEEVAMEEVAMDEVAMEEVAMDDEEEDREAAAPAEAGGEEDEFGMRTVSLSPPSSPGAPPQFSWGDGEADEPSATTQVRTAPPPASTTASQHHR